MGVRQGQARPGQEAAGSSENQGNAAPGVEVPGAPGRLSLEVGRWAVEAGLLGPTWLCSWLPEGSRHVPTLLGLGFPTSQVS